MKSAFSLAIGLLCALPCASPLMAGPSALDPVAEAYVKLVLKVGLYDPLYVDSYYGPEEWRPSDKRPASVAYPLDQLAREADSLIGRMKELADSTPNKMRYDYLLSQLTSVRGTIDKVSGMKMTFDEESMALYGTIAPHEVVNTDSLMKVLDSLLPGTGSILDRLDSFRARLVIPSLLIDTVFNMAMSEVRRRSRELLDLPTNESITMEYVTDKSWGGYNRYQGNCRSLISVNLDIPFYITDALFFTSHEGYPGHHVQGIVQEKRFVQDSCWVEFSIFALYSPQAVITEGMAEYARCALFTPREQLDFELKRLCPIAGLDSSLARVYSRVANVVKSLQSIEIDIARNYLDGKVDSQETVRLLTEQALYESSQAKNLVEFIQDFRSYYITYRVGEAMVRQFVEGSMAPGDMATRRASYVRILTTPYTPAALAAGP